MRSLSLVFGVVLAGVVAAPAVHPQCSVKFPSTCTILGPGHPGPPPMSLPSSVTLVWGAATGTLTVQVPHGQNGFAALLLKVGNPAPVAMGTPVLCAPGIVYPWPPHLINFGVDPTPPYSVAFIFPLPRSLRGRGIPLALQGFGFGGAGCARATQGYRIVL